MSVPKTEEAAAVPTRAARRGLLRPPLRPSRGCQGTCTRTSGVGRLRGRDPFGPLVRALPRLARPGEPAMSPAPAPATHRGARVSRRGAARPNSGAAPLPAPRPLPAGLRRGGAGRGCARTTRPTVHRAGRDRAPRCAGPGTSLPPCFSRLAALPRASLSTSAGHPARPASPRLHGPWQLRPVSATRWRHLGPGRLSPRTGLRPPLPPGARWKPVFFPLCLGPGP